MAKKKGIKAHRTMGQTFQTVTLGGNHYTLRPPKVGSLYGGMEAYIVSLRKDPIETAIEACKKAPQEQHDRIWDRAIAAASDARIVSASELKQFEESIRGLAWKVLQMIQQDHPEIKSVDQMISILERVTEDEWLALQARMRVVSGEDDLKN